MTKTVKITGSLLFILLIITLFVLIFQQKPEYTIKEDDYANRFIAHAGGAIDGIKYTNSIEALNLSYSKGCKLFELDLVETADGKIVAKHDPTKLTEKEFMSRLIRGKYTPMNMESINDWFRNHPDAILVTDKINDPERIFNEFQFPDRLIMELFTWEAIDKAIELGIKPLVTQNLIYKTPDFVKEMKKRKIEYFGYSRRYIKDKEKLLKQLKKNGVKIYLYNLEKKIDNIQSMEQYVWDNEMEYCYGMYANDLDILFLLNNAKL